MFIPLSLDCCQGWSGGAIVLGKLPVPGRPTIWITLGQGLTALAVGAGGFFFFFWTFVLFTILSLLSPSLWEAARYRLKYCLKGPLNQKQPTNQLQCCLYRKWRPRFFQLWENGWLFGGLTAL